MKEPMDGGDESRLDTPAFWEELQETFETAIGLLHEMAEAQGINVEIPAGDDVREEEERLDTMARNHPLAVEGEEYAQEVDVWFHGAKEAIHKWGLEATRLAESDGSAAEIEREADDLQEAIETIADARYRINVKLLRALRTRLRTTSSVLSTIPGAAEKAAVEAYVLVEDSIRHWMRLREIIPGEEDAILHLLVRLGRLREGMESEFVEVVTESADVQMAESLDHRSPGTHGAASGKSRTRDDD